MLKVNTQILQVASVEVLELQMLSVIITYQLGADDVPRLGVGLEVRILHQRIVLEEGLPLLLVFAVAASLAGELLNRYLVAVIILEAQIAKVRRFILLLEVDLDIRVAWALRLRLLLVADRSLGEHDRELVVFFCVHIIQ